LALQVLVVLQQIQILLSQSLLLIEGPWLLLLEYLLLRLNLWLRLWLRLLLVLRPENLILVRHLQLLLTIVKSQSIQSLICHEVILLSSLRQVHLSLLKFRKLFLLCHLVQEFLPLGIVRVALDLLSLMQAMAGSQVVVRQVLIALCRRIQQDLICYWSNPMAVYYLLVAMPIENLLIKLVLIELVHLLDLRYPQLELSLIDRVVDDDPVGQRQFLIYLVHDLTVLIIVVEASLLLLLKQEHLIGLKLTEATSVVRVACPIAVLSSLCALGELLRLTPHGIEVFTIQVHGLSLVTSMLVVNRRIILAIILRTKCAQIQTAQPISHVAAADRQARALVLLRLRTLHCKLILCWILLKNSWIRICF